LKYSLDAWAVVAWLQNVEPAASRVEEAFNGKPIMSWVNLGEVYYIMHRQKSRNAADLVLQDVRAQLYLDEATSERTLAAARIKAVHTMSYADAFALATAVAHDSILLTGDPEILAAKGNWQTEDLRSPIPGEV
jgi:predicted nucleic acid-binding protein